MNYSQNDLQTLAKTIYGEARGELHKFGIVSLIAVANVVVNRKRKNFANSIAEVCVAPYQFSCWSKSDPNYKKMMRITSEEAHIFGKCLETAENVLSEKWPDITDGCDHYHERSIRPYWAVYLIPKRIFGSHYFYVLKN
ncbi:MAG: cell wall hydrolase [Holosporaceae bacterium]|nr:cell wall hydrolase [Holosporaceae bacterium]